MTIGWKNTSRNFNKLLFFGLFLFYSSEVLAVYKGQVTQENSPAYRTQVKLFHKTTEGYEYHCSGVLIKDDVVLTAGHCLLDDDGSPYDIQVGFDPIDQMNAEETIQAQTQYLHPRYEDHPRRITDDLGIIILQTSAPKEYVPAKLLTSPELFKVPTQVHIAGSGFYGFKNESIGFSRKDNLFFNKRQTTNRTAVAFENLIYDPYKIIFSSELGELEHPEGAICPGDSGGPHYALIQGQWQVVGISSSSTVYCLAGNAKAVHVGGYLNWIESTLQKHFRTSTIFGFSQYPDSAEWNSNIFPKNFHSPNTARNPHYECHLIKGASHFKAPPVINLSLVSLTPTWKQSKRKGRFLFNKLTIDIEIGKDLRKSYFTGHSMDKIPMYTPFQEKTIIEFEHYQNALTIDFASRRNNGNFQTQLIDEDANEANYSCVQRKELSGQLYAYDKLRFTNKDISIYSAIAAGNPICEIPQQTTLPIQNFAFDYKIFDAHIRPQFSSEQDTQLPPCLKSNPFLVDGAYGVNFLR